jgi:8-oxo-dGTP diphosphatase
MVVKSNRAGNKVGRFMVAAGAVIELRRTGRILVLKRADSRDWQAGEWELMYGRIDQFETPEQGLRREVMEETSIKSLEIVELLTAWHIYRGQKRKAEDELIGVTYRGRVKSEQVKLSREHSEYRWVTPREALKLIKIEGIARDVKAFISKRRLEE